MSRLVLGLMAGLVSVPAFAEETATGTAPAMTEAERKAFRDEVRAYLLENPEVLVEAMDVLQQREELAGLERDTKIIAANSARIFANPNDWVGGNPEGDITLVEFMDYRCGYCRKAYAEVEELIASDGNIRFVVKEFPILGEASMMSAQFAIALRQLHGDEAYEKAHHALIALRGEPTVETLTRLAGDLGYEAQPVFDRMNSPEVMAVIQDNYALAEMMDISGTPAFIMGDGVMRGYAPLDVMRDFVADMRADG